MYLKFFLIYSFLIVNNAECTILFVTRSRPNFDFGIGALYGAPTFKSTKLTKNHHSTNVKQTYENPILLSPEDSEDKFPVMDLINSYSPTKDSNPFSPGQSLEKGLISNKLPAVHRHNLKTKMIYNGKPYILVAIVVSSVVAMTALTGGIIFYSKKKN